MQAIRGNVLIVEDDLECGELMLRTLTHAGYGVRWARGREQAATALNQYPYDYIILDYAMPGTIVEDFVELCQAKTQNIVLTSAVVSAEQQANRLGLSHWISKPFTPEQLLAVMRGLSSGVRRGISEQKV